MSYPVRLASGFSLAVTIAFALVGTSGAKAHPQDLSAQAIQDLSMQVGKTQTPTTGTPYPVLSWTDATPPTSPSDSTTITVQPLQDAPVDSGPVDPGTTGDAVTTAGSLAELVDLVPPPPKLSADIDCLAGAIYFEAQSESLAGQLAVGRVIVARTASGHFPTSYCGVVLQHSQFSFVRAGTMPAINRSSRVWQRVVKIALIADRGAWKSPAEGALFFHAARIGAIAGKTRVARIDNHVFYR